METLQISGVLPDKIGLMYFDPQTETLKEVDGTSLYLACLSYEYVIRRFYICGELLEYNSTVRIIVGTEDSDLYTTKVTLGQVNPIYSSFEFSTNELLVTSAELGTMYNNAIPIDVLVVSIAATEKLVSLDIKLVVEDTVTLPIEGV